MNLYLHVLFYFFCRDFSIEDYKAAVEDTPVNGGVFVNVANEVIEESS